MRNPSFHDNNRLAIGQGLSQEDALQLILDSFEDTLLLLDKNLHIVLASDRTRQKIRELYGFTIGPNTSILELATPKELPLVTDVCARVLQGAVETTESQIVIDGAVNYIKHYFQPIKDAAENVTGLVVRSKNITDKKKAEIEQLEAKEQLALSEQQYRTLFYNNPLPCWIYHSRTLKFLEVNEAAVRHYGYSRDEFLNLSIFDIQVEDNMADFLQLFTGKVVQKTFSLTNWRHKIKDGRSIFIDLKSNAINYQGAEARLVVVQDVTPRVVIETELRKSNERFRLAAIASSEALWEWDMLTEEAYISSTYTDILGWKAEEFRKYDTWEDYIHPDDKNQTLESYYRAIQDNTVDRWEKEYRYLKADGTYAVVHDKAVILRNIHGRALKVVGALRNITNEKQIEEEIRRTNERYKHVILATHDMIWDWDLATNEMLWSDSFFEKFGWPAHKGPVLSFDHCTDHLYPDDRERVVQGLHAVINDPKQTNWQDSFRYQRANGSYAYVTDRGYVIRDSEGKAIRMIGAMKDITESKRSEDLLSLERTIFELSANPEHEIQKVVETFLNGIEEIYPEAITSVFLLSEDHVIESVIAPRFPASLTAAIKGSPIGPDEGCSGAAMYFKKTFISADTSNDPLYQKYKDQVARFRLSACWSFPIIHASGRVMGSFSVYYNTPQAPSPEELTIFERFRNILRIVMENRWSLQQIKTDNERFDIVMKATHDLIWDWDLSTNTVYRDPAGVKSIYGMESNSEIYHMDRWLTYIHPEDQGKVKKIIDGIRHSSKPEKVETEYRFKRVNGTYAHIYDRGIIIRDESGQAVRVIGAAQDISERKRLERELLNTELEHQKAINLATIETQEQERMEIGKELHDNVNQLLTTTKLYLDLAFSSPDLKDELILKSNKNILNVINEIRQLSRSLMNPSIGDLGLMDSVRDLIENINLTRKLNVSLSTDEKLEDLLDKNQKLTVFRIIQEALNNAIKHAKATGVSIRMAQNTGAAEVIIEDNGIGFNVQTVRRGAGLKNIQNRIYLINGSHTIESTLNKGSRIMISFPIMQTNTLHPQ